MQIVNTLSIDLRNQGFPQRIRATQADANTRVVEVSLYDGGVVWPIPDGVAAAVGYRKPDGTAGLYDKLPDGTNALTILENTVTAILAPQVLTASGIVSAVIILTDDSMRQLSTFPFQIYVEKNPAAGLVVSDNYINVVDAIGDLNALVTEDKTSLVAAINEIARNNGEYIEEHNTDPTSHADIRKRLSAANIVESASGDVIAVSDSSDMELAGLRIFGKTVQNGTPTPDAPVPLQSVGDGGSVTATVCGKNLFDVNSATNQSVDASGVVSSSPNGRLTDFIPVMEQYVTISGNLREGITAVTGQFRILCYDADTNFVARVLGGKKTTITADVSNCAYIRLNFFTNEFDETTVQMEWGNTATEFEPYSGSSVTVSTPNSLPGIPVTSGGNYTDENGQQWLCDEVDFEKGVYVQRIGKRTVENARNKTWGKTSGGIPYVELTHEIGKYCNTASGMALSNAYPWASESANMVFRTYIDTVLVCDERFTDLDTGLELLTSIGFEALYVLRDIDIIETALSEEEVAHYAALHTNYPNTTVFNDGGAGMEVTYVADTKLYVDKKFAELSTALLNQ